MDISFPFIVFDNTVLSTTHKPLSGLITENIESSSATQLRFFHFACRHPAACRKVDFCHRKGQFPFYQGLTSAGRERDEVKGDLPVQLNNLCFFSSYTLSLSA